MTAVPQVSGASREIMVRTALSHTLIEASTLTDQQVADAVARAISAG